MVIANFVVRRFFKKRVEIMITGVIEDPTIHAHKRAGYADGEAWAQHDIIERHFLEDFRGPYVE